MLPRNWRYSVRPVVKIFTMISRAIINLMLQPFFSNLCLSDALLIPLLFLSFPGWLSWYFCCQLFWLCLSGMNMIPLYTNLHADIASIHHIINKITISGPFYVSLAAFSVKAMGNSISSTTNIHQRWCSLLLKYGITIFWYVAIFLVIAS
jgi:hypothetical protein